VRPERLAIAALVLLAVGQLDDLLRLQTLNVELDARQRLALLLVVLGLRTLAVELDEGGHVLAHLVEAGGARRFGTGAEHVHRFQVELGCE
jgi:hypothetical protein